MFDAWNNVLSYVLSLGRHEEYVISKFGLPPIPAGFERRFGLPLGTEHYNLPVTDGRAIHLKVVGENYSIHWDQVDPNRNPLGHLLVDAPKETVGALIFGAIADELFLNGRIRKGLLNELK